VSALKFRPTAGFTSTTSSQHDKPIVTSNVIKDLVVYDETKVPLNFLDIRFTPRIF
jgi:hypothetical protein